MSQITEKYIPGHSPTSTAFMARRDLESHGFFLSPLLQPGFEVLDAGCGPATITTGVAQSVFPGRVTAFDVSSKALEHGRRLSQGLEIMNIDFVAGSSHAMPFADHSFDVVFSHALLEHLHNPWQTMQEFHRVTRPGGFIAVCSPDWDEFDLSPHPSRVARAITAYRILQECHGGNTRAGASLRDWITSAGFVPLTHDKWMEEEEDTHRIAEYLALQLDQAGQFHHATALRNWAQDPTARFRQCWKFATGVRADDGKRAHLLVE